MRVPLRDIKTTHLKSEARSGYSESPLGFGAEPLVPVAEDSARKFVAD